MNVLDPSVVLSKGGGAKQRFLLAPASPDVIVDGGADGAVASVPQGNVVTALVDNSYAPTSSWIQVAGTQAISAGTRRAFRFADSTAVPLAIAFT